MQRITAQKEAEEKLVIYIWAAGFLFELKTPKESNGLRTANLDECRETGDNSKFWNHQSKVNIYIETHDNINQTACNGLRKKHPSSLGSQHSRQVNVEKQTDLLSQKILVKKQCPSSCIMGMDHISLCLYFCRLRVNGSLPLHISNQSPPLSPCDVGLWATCLKNASLSQTVLLFLFPNVEEIKEINTDPRPITDSFRVNTKLWALVNHFRFFGVQLHTVYWVAGHCSRFLTVVFAPNSERGSCTALLYWLAK